MSKPLVKCSVANCTYWKEGNSCGADSIMIDIDSHAKVDYNAEFAGEEFDSAHQDVAQAVASTCCHTFKAKSS